ncbi:hypothetical protein AVEN_114114-1 [Araneus ventricosus]|uniref:Uncharacterized protein n=1 Tax=Araneus ventricosus TaxID=182803 RepID=A0A4Y1ZV36_ARAVE|nr:hypothetical protein AVEN_114114-1 [Araneus ventricosus]
MMADDLQSACTSLLMGMVRSQCGSVLIRTYKGNGLCTIKEALNIRNILNKFQFYLRPAILEGYRHSLITLTFSFEGTRGLMTEFVLLNLDQKKGTKMKPVHTISSLPHHTSRKTCAPLRAI